MIRRAPLPERVGFRRGPRPQAPVPEAAEEPVQRGNAPRPVHVVVQPVACTKCGHPYLMPCNDDPGRLKVCLNAMVIDGRFPPKG